jgi:RimJ/RimL family protein N-acetyltransferase
MKNIDLESERLKLRRVSSEHLTEDYVSWLNDPIVNIFLDTKGTYTLDLLKSYLDELNNNEVYFWAIHLKETNKHIGNIKIDLKPTLSESEKHISYKELTHSNNAEYGILMGDKLSWGKGYGKEATIQIIKYCFEELKLSEIILGVIEDHIKAVELYKNIGFVVDGVIKDIGTYNNKLSNGLRMSLHVKNFK